MIKEIEKLVTIDKPQSKQATEAAAEFKYKDDVITEKFKSFDIRRVKKEEDKAKPKDKEPKDAIVEDSETIEDSLLEKFSLQ